MKPSDDDNQRNVQVPARDNQPGFQAPDRSAAAQLMRQQIDSIYDNADESTTNPQHSTHSEAADHTAAKTELSDEWKHYHSSWQNYYQQYYERYYVAQLHKRQQQVVPQEMSKPVDTTGSAQPVELSRDEAVNELRTKIIGEVKQRSQTVRKSRHFMPAVSAIAVALTFAFLQYNSLIFAQVKAAISPGSINPQNIILDPTTSTKVSNEPRIIIPKINVDAPVVYDVPSLDEHIVQSKLKSGVVHYPIPGASSFPGQTGNTVILGHSSNDVFDDGGYKFVFVQLDKLNKGDTFYLNYQGTRFTYSVTEKKVIDPTQVGQLVINNGKPLATLVTCTPPGTALKRLVVIAEQISPDPDKASAAAAKEGSSKPSSIAGNAPSILERLFGNN
jgi:sortase A